MKSIIIKLLKMIPETFFRKVCGAAGYKVASSGIADISYSQDAEDIFLRHIFAEKNDGFFIDIGAHHPIRLSNTYALYQRGWRGINVDPLPGTKALFNAIRPGDITIESGVAAERGALDYHMFNSPAVNTFSKENADLNLTLGYKRIEVRKVPVETIVAIIDAHAKGREIDLLTIDVEGRELSILKSNDWTRFRPKVILAESMKTDQDDLAASIFKNDSKKYWIALDELETQPLHIYLTSIGYRPLCKGIVTTVYIDAVSLSKNVL